MIRLTCFSSVVTWSRRFSRRVSCRFQQWRDGEGCWDPGPHWDLSSLLAPLPSPHSVTSLEFGLESSPPQHFTACSSRLIRHRSPPLPEKYVYFPIGNSRRHPLQLRFEGTVFPHTVIPHCLGIPSDLPSFPAKGKEVQVIGTPLLETPVMSARKLTVPPLTPIHLEAPSRGGVERGRGHLVGGAGSAQKTPTRLA